VPPPRYTPEIGVQGSEALRRSARPTQLVLVNSRLFSGGHCIANIASCSWPARPRTYWATEMARLKIHNFDSDGKVDLAVAEGHAPGAPPTRRYRVAAHDIADFQRAVNKS